MDISKRLAELARMKAEGQLSDESFESLTKLAIEEAIENSSVSTADKAIQKSSWLKAAPPKALFGIVAVVLAVVVFVFFNGRSSDPMDSKEYKKLLDTRNELIAKQAELEATLQENPDRTEELAIITAKVDRWTAALAAITESGL